jgi:hypothetical protein
VSEAVVSQGATDENGAAPEAKTPFRRRLPDERRALTHHFSVGGQEGYITVGLYEDGVPGEIFITMSKEGSTVSGLMDCFATSVSLALQYGVPLKVRRKGYRGSVWSPRHFIESMPHAIGCAILVAFERNRYLRSDRLSECHNGVW